MNVHTKSKSAGCDLVPARYGTIPVTPPMNKTILLIDDDRPSRRALRLHLESRGFVCQEADNGLEALKLLDRGLKIDLVVSDYHMPIINGVEFLQALSYRVNGQNIPVILVSGHWTTEMTHEAKQAGAFELLPKPYNHQELMALVSRACKNTL